MLVLAIALGVAAWWWYTQEMPRRERERAAAAEIAAAHGKMRIPPCSDATPCVSRSSTSAPKRKLPPTPK